MDDATWQEFADKGCILQSAPDWWLAEELTACTRDGEDFVGMVEAFPGKSVSKRKAYMRYGDADPRLPHTILFRMACALQPFADRVCGPQARLFMARYIVTLPMTEAPTWSQLWHRDPEGVPVLKVFLHLRAVEACHGPFEYVPGTSRNRELGLCSPQGREPKAGAWTMPTRITCIGPAGMVALADTSGVHRGGLVTEGLRLQAMWGFVAHDTPIGWGGAVTRYR